MLYRRTKKLDKRFIFSNELGHCGEKRGKRGRRREERDKRRGEEREEKGRGERIVLRGRFCSMVRKTEKIGRMQDRRRGSSLGRKRGSWKSRKGEEGRGRE